MGDGPDSAKSRQEAAAREVSSGSSNSSSSSSSSSSHSSTKIPSPLMSVWSELFSAIGKGSSDQSASLSSLWSVLRPERARLQLALGALCISSTTTLSYPYLMGKLVDIFGTSGAGGIQFVIDHSVLCGAVILIGGIGTFCRLFLIETAIEKIAFRLRRELYGALLGREVAFFDANKTGELVNRLSNDITVTSRVLIDISAGLRSSISAVVGTCMVFSLAPTEMIMVLLTPVGVLFVVGMLYGRAVRRISEAKQQRLANAVQLAEERLSGIRTVHMFNAESHELRQFEGRLDEVYAAGRQYALASGGLSCLFATGGGLFLLHLIYQSGMLVTSGVVSMGTTVSLAMYTFMAGSSYAGLMTAYGDVQKSLGACAKVMDILQQATSVPDEGAQPAATRPIVASSFVPPDVDRSVPLALRLEGVTFAYPARPTEPVLRGVDLDLPAGSRVALLGGSGSGKSTIASLIAGLYAPSSGRIMADGIDLFNTPGATAWVRAQMGYVSQEPTLFAMSIRENVSYGTVGALSPQAPEDEEQAMRSATKMAHVDEFAEKMHSGFDSGVGERGLALSGGQRQRVCIARALARSPRMLVLDEATSALDLRSEAIVHEALKEVLAAQKLTCLVITHRLSALEWVDRVAVMDGGRVVQIGPKDEVMRSPCSALATLLRSSER